MVRNEGGVVSGMLNLEIIGIGASSPRYSTSTENGATRGGVKFAQKAAKIPLPTYGGGWN